MSGARGTAPDVTEVEGRAEDLQDLLYGGDGAARPAAEGFEDPATVAAAVEGATESMEVYGGSAGPTAAPGSAGEEAGAVRVDTAVIHEAAVVLARVVEDMGATTAGLVPVTAELELWSLSGQPQIDGAVTLGLVAGRDLLGVVEGTLGTAGRLGLALSRYELTENALTGSFSSALLDSPLGAAGAAVAREASRTVEDLDVAFARAGVDSVAEFGERVSISGFGILVRGGGPRGTDAIIRPLGLDDILDAGLQLRLSTPDGAEGVDAAGAAGSTTAPEGAGAPTAGPGAASSSGVTLGEFLRWKAVDLLTDYGAELDASAEPADWSTSSFPVKATASAQCVLFPLAGLTGAAAGLLPTWFSTRSTGRLLSAAEKMSHTGKDALRPWLMPMGLRTAKREVFTGLSPANAAAHRMTAAPGRALPSGVASTGTVPTTLAGTAATLKDAKNIVSGAGPDGEPFENSTVMVQKATDAQGHSAYSVVLTGTEAWVDGLGVHDLKGIADGMTATRDAALADLPQAQRMAVQALRDAGIRQGDSVVLSGHSLGGIDAAGLAANSAFRGLYDVQAVTTYGAPVGDFAIPEETSVMAVEHVDDLVPTLDGVPNPDGAHRSTVRVNTPYEGATTKDGLRGVKAHEMNLYTLGAQGISRSHHPAVAEHERRLAEAIPHGAGTRTETYVYEGWEQR
ncbi:hypothetical protein KVA01_02600 [Kocuria varians]|uniref:Fungal lipase-like domain-containing protein n=1 Tax=Kocuria varians TaxID=1272 RepID=A0A4Y4CYU7_KOCVA|nr:hypothetical protein [Kocuria varians]GEC98105.1 hypothetical protein KVA01_02600 [Kocuria varians]